MAGGKLGLVSLGMTRARTHHAYSRSSNRGQPYEDFFCLTPIGVRVGYASPKLVRLAGHSRLLGLVVWISSANPIYAVAGIRPGAALAATEAKLHGGNLFHIGINLWYLARWRSVTAIFKVRHGLVQEIGIANEQLTRTHEAEHAFLTSGFA